MLPRGVNVAQPALQRRSVVHGAGSAQRIAAADDVGAGRMDPGAALQALRKICLVIERACHRALPLVFGLNLHERARRAKGSMEPAEFMLEHGRVPEIGSGKELAAAAAGEGREVGNRSSCDAGGGSGMKAAEKWRGGTFEKPRHA